MNIILNDVHTAHNETNIRIRNEELNRKIPFKYAALISCGQTWKNGKVGCWNLESRWNRNRYRLRNDRMTSNIGGKA